MRIVASPPSQPTRVAGSRSRSSGPTTVTLLAGVGDCVTTATPDRFV
jgi:hypothetical protein